MTALWIFMGVVFVLSAIMMVGNYIFENTGEYQSGYTPEPQPTSAGRSGLDQVVVPLNQSVEAEEIICDPLTDEPLADDAVLMEIRTKRGPVKAKVNRSTKEKYRRKGLRAFRRKRKRGFGNRRYYVSCDYDLDDDFCDLIEDILWETILFDLVDPLLWSEDYDEEEYDEFWDDGEVYEDEELPPWEDVEEEFADVSDEAVEEQLADPEIQEALEEQDEAIRETLSTGAVVSPVDSETLRREEALEALASSGEDREESADAEDINDPESETEDDSSDLVDES